MSEILPYIMPADLQAAALAEVTMFGIPDVIVRTDAVLEAEHWFTDTVKCDVGTPFEHYVFVNAYHKSHNGDIVDSDVHTDSKISEFNTKFLLTLSDIAFASTIYFPELVKVNAGVRHTTAELFFRDPLGKITSRLSPAIKTGYKLQGVNGQISKFAIDTDSHAAAPLPKGAKKLLFVLKAKL